MFHWFSIFGNVLSAALDRVRNWKGMYDAEMMQVCFIILNRDEDIEITEKMMSKRWRGETYEKNMDGWNNSWRLSAL